MVKHVLNAVASDRHAFEAEIARLRQRFRERVGASAHGDLAGRIGDAFSLFYGAAEIAKRAGALPKAFRAFAPVAVCYRLCLQAMKPPRSGRERLMDLAKEEGVVDLRTTPLRAMTDEELDAVPAFLDISKADELLLLVTRPALARALRDWRLVLQDADVAAMMVRDADQDKPKHPLRQGTRDRVYQFVLGPAETAAAPPAAGTTPTLFDEPRLVEKPPVGKIASSDPAEEKRRARASSAATTSARASRSRLAQTRVASRTRSRSTALKKPERVGAKEASGVPELRIGAAVRAVYPGTKRRYPGKIGKLRLGKALIEWADGDDPRWVHLRKVLPSKSGRNPT